MADLPEHRSGSYWPGLRWVSIGIDGTPADLTGAIATFQVRRGEKALHADIDWRSDTDPPEITIDAGDGTITVPAQNALEMGEATYVWEMELKLSDGRVFPIGYGEWPVVIDVARRDY